MQVKNVVSNVLVDFVLELEKAVSQGYKVVPESVDWQAGYWKCKTEKEGVVEVEEDISSRMTLTILNSAEALEMLDNPGEPNEKLKEIFADLVPTGSDVEIGVDRVSVIEPVVAQKPKRNRK